MGPILTRFFLVYEEREDPNTTKSGSSSARKRFAGGPIDSVVIFRRSEPVLLRNPINL